MANWYHRGQKSRGINYFKIYGYGHKPLPKRRRKSYGYLDSREYKEHLKKMYRD